MSSSELAIGIDLGTTNSCVAIVRDDIAEIIPNEFHERTTPSMVTICKDGTRYLGKEAKINQFKYIQNTIYESKRLLGRKFEEHCVQDKLPHWPFKVIEEEGNVKIEVPQANRTCRSFFPQEISAMVLEKMKAIAHGHLREPVKKAVITVPAYFDDRQRQATIDAARIAGLETLTIMNEPTAAALAYIVKNNITHTTCNTLVFDLGGGTFDVSIVKTDGNTFTVAAVNGDSDLGGADLDVLVYNEIVGIIRKKFNKTIDLRKEQIHRIKARCITVKEQLSHALTAEFDLPIIDGEDDDFEYTFTREQFEKLVKPIVRQIMSVVKRTLQEVNLTAEDIVNIVLVGGSSRIPIIRQELQEFFKKDLSSAVNPDEAVAIGAAIHANRLINNKRGGITDITPFSLGIEAENVKMDVIIKKNTTLPASFTKEYTTMVDDQEAIRIGVFQGEDELTVNNKKLGYFDLTGIPPQPARIPRIYVSFDINTNGVLHITAVDNSSNKMQNMKIITNKGGLSEEDFDEINNKKCTV